MKPSNHPLIQALGFPAAALVALCIAGLLARWSEMVTTAFITLAMLLSFGLFLAVVLVTLLKPIKPLMLLRVAAIAGVALGTISIAQLADRFSNSFHPTEVLLSALLNGALTASLMVVDEIFHWIKGRL